MPKIVGRTLATDRQQLIEETYSKDRVDEQIREGVLGMEAVQLKVEEGVQIITEWLEQDYFVSKNERLNQVKEMNLQGIVENIFVETVYCQIPELFTNVTGKVAARLGFADRADAIRTVAELMAVLKDLNIFSLFKADLYDSIYVQSMVTVPQELQYDYLIASYLPPMVCEPATLHKNDDSATFRSTGSLILGSGNHHDEDICLDVLNSKNKVKLCLDIEFLSTYEEVPKTVLDTDQKQRNWDNFKRDSYKFYELIVKQGNEFYLPHKFDKRGRTYSQGYHINTQGTSFKKACIDLADGEQVLGVPEEYQHKYTVNGGKMDMGEESIKYSSKPMTYKDAEVEAEGLEYPLVFIQEENFYATTSTTS